jgi:hypothetical protein
LSMDFPSGLRSVEKAIVLLRHGRAETPFIEYPRMFFRRQSPAISTKFYIYPLISVFLCF